MSSIVILNVSTTIFGITALILASKARSRLSPGSLRTYMDNFNICLAFIVIFSMWQTIRSFLSTSLKFTELAEYPEYIFIVFAYFAFIITSYRMVKIGREFGFKDEGLAIKKILDSDKKNAKGNAKSPSKQ